MIAQTPCPCCGHVVAPGAELRWNEHSRTLCGPGGIAMLSAMQGKIFSKLWKAWPSGRMIKPDEMMAHCYADHADGGPDSNNVISVHMNFLRKRIAPLGLSIGDRRGYLIYRIEAISRSKRTIR